MSLGTYSYADPSTLAQVIGQIVDTFGAIGNATPIMVGKHYLEQFGTGSAPRVLFVPEPDGQMGPPTETGYAASDTHSCDVYIRGAEDGSDLGRFNNAYAIKKILVTALRRAGAGRIEFKGRSGDSSPTNVDAYGADLTFGFTYQRDIVQEESVMRLPRAALDATAQTPNLPPGTMTGDVEIDVTTNIEEP